MNCTSARRLFSACWDDELTQAERDWLEGHLSRCAACRAEYDVLARTLEAVGTLPRAEAAPELAERVLARVQRAPSAPDMMPVAAVPWAPITAAAASVLVIAGLLLAPGHLVPRVPARTVIARLEPPQQPQLKHPQRMAARTPASTPSAAHAGSATVAAGVPDSVFDHAEDVELVLDPVTLHHGRASLARSRATTPVQGEQAVISF